MAKKPWGGAGDWAADSERAESQLEQEEPMYEQPQLLDIAFPSLGEAAHTKISKKKKQTLSLGQFISSGAPVLSESKGLTAQEKMALPTGPRDRSGEEQSYGGLGGGFKDYGGYRGDWEYGRDREGGYGSRRSDRDREFGFGRGFFGGDKDGLDEPSRADVADDWGATKKLTPSRGHYEDDGRRGGRFDDQDFPSKADEDTDWSSSKKYVPASLSSGAHGRVSRYAFSSSRIGNKADESDNWGVAKKSAASGRYERERDFWTREKDGADGDTWTRSRDGERAPESGRPRLVLKARSQPVDDLLPPASKENAKDQLPISEISTEVFSKPQKVNPFGEAKPREVILEEKGLNWKKIDADLEQKLLFSGGEAEESPLKEDVKALQDAIKAAETESIETSFENETSDMLASLKEQLAAKERKLQECNASFSDKAGGLRGQSEKLRSGGRDSDFWSRPATSARQPALSERKGGCW